MNKYLFGFLITGLLLGADQKPAANPGKEQLRGLWNRVGVEVVGDASPVKACEMKCLFEENKVTLKRGPVVESFTYEVNADHSPAYLDAVYLEGVLKGTRLKFIYEFDGDTLKVAAVGSGLERPKSFKAQDVVIFTLKRVSK